MVCADALMLAAVVATIIAASAAASLFFLVIFLFMFFIFVFLLFYFKIVCGCAVAPIITRSSFLCFLFYYTLITTRCPLQYLYSNYRSGEGGVWALEDT